MDEAIERCFLSSCDDTLTPFQPRKFRHHHSTLFRFHSDPFPASSPHVQTHTYTTHVHTRARGRKNLGGNEAVPFDPSQSIPQGAVFLCDALRQLGTPIDFDSVHSVAKAPSFLRDAAQELRARRERHVNEISAVRLDALEDATSRRGQL